MSSFEDFKKFVAENSVTIVLTLMLIAIVYVNIKVNDVDYRLQQTIINQYGRRNEQDQYRGFYSDSQNTRYR